MADGIVGLAADGTGKKIDTSELTVSGLTVERQRIVIADPTGAPAIASVQPTGSDGQSLGSYGLLTTTVLELLNSAGTDDRIRAGQLLGSVLTNPMPSGATSMVAGATTQVGASIKAQFDPVAGKKYYIFGFDVTLGPGTATTDFVTTGGFVDAPGWVMTTHPTESRSLSIRFPIPYANSTVGQGCYILIQAMGGANAKNSVQAYGFAV